MRAARSWLIVFAPWAVACSLEADVQHQGDYTFLPGAPRPDTAPRALHQLLLVEDDALLAARRYYYFTGDLGPLGLGIESLPRLLQREGRYSLLFENPFDAYDPKPPEEGDTPETEPEPIPTLALDADGATIPLFPLASSDLARVGASRFIGALESGAFAAKAFLGREPSAEPLTRIHVPVSAEDALGLAPKLAPSNPELIPVENGLALDAGLVTRPDYLRVELYQTLWRVPEERQLEAVLRISIAPGADLIVTPEALTNAFHALCWFKDLPLQLRVTQVARSVIGTPKSESAFIEQHADTVDLPSDWTDLVSDAEPRAYCSAYTREAPEAP